MRNYSTLLKAICMFLVSFDIQRLQGMWSKCQKCSICYYAFVNWKKPEEKLCVFTLAKMFSFFDKGKHNASNEYDSVEAIDQLHLLLSYKSTKFDRIWANREDFMRVFVRIVLGEDSVWHTFCANVPNCAKLCQMLQIMKNDWKNYK